MILFFDTETTGFFNDRVPVDHASQPHLVQLAALLCQPDGAEVMSVSLIVNPSVPIPTQASNVHGITDAIAAERGVTPDMAVDLFAHLYRLADTVVAHNIKFDKGIMEAAIARRHGKVLRLSKPLFCTMEAASPIVNLPPTDRMLAAGFDKPKPPKLEECIRHFFDEALDGAHDALIDVAACRRVYFHLKTLEN
ncbi:3'-5' exonuclease [Sphingomonas sp. TX0522]|uniref:3'-5' exonuclease n=1 Tax=Sphingomonas sp. TX0522 TaxID=2479205 RepID=UPI0018DF8E83|nr:3'-5' exonuclease [Sphingomonas sp. TX0522]